MQNYHYIAPMNIYEKLVDIQGRLKAPKNQRNNFGKYNYRSCEDILEALKPLLVEHKLALTVSDETKDIAGIPFIEACAVLSDGKSQVHAKAQAGIDPSRKGMDISQSFGSSSSYARKYALNGLFLIDDTKDADATNTHSKKSNMVSKLEELKPNTENFDKVKNALSQGFTIADVKQKYAINKEVEQLLLS